MRLYMHYDLPHISDTVKLSLSLQAAKIHLCYVMAWILMLECTIDNVYRCNDDSSGLW